MPHGNVISCVPPPVKVQLSNCATAVSEPTLSSTCDALREYTIRRRTSGDKHLTPRSASARRFSADTVRASSDNGDTDVEAIHMRMIRGGWLALVNPLTDRLPKEIPAVSFQVPAHPPPRFVARRRRELDPGRYHAWYVLSKSSTRKNSPTRRRTARPTMLAWWPPSAAPAECLCGLRRTNHDPALRAAVMVNARVSSRVELQNVRQRSGSPHVVRPRARRVQMRHRGPDYSSSPRLTTIRSRRRLLATLGDVAVNSPGLMPARSSYVLVRLEHEVPE